MSVAKAHAGRRLHWTMVSAIAAGGLIAVTLWAAFYVAPEEVTMGEAQRILYVHVPVAWMGLLLYTVAAGAGVGYLITRRLAWDHWMAAAFELGWLASALTLATGSFWAQSAWGTAWTWDPRLTSSFVLFLMYGGCNAVRRMIGGAEQRARVSAVLACVGAVDVPLVIMATRWFRGMHPVTPELDSRMRAVLWLAIFSFTFAFGVLLVYRRRQIARERRAV